MPTDFGNYLPKNKMQHMSSVCTTDSAPNSFELAHEAVALLQPVRLKLKLTKLCA